MMIGELPMSRTIKTAEDRKKEIIQVAEILFMENGFNNVTTTTIAKTAKVAKGTLFYHFETKDNLADAVITSQLAPLKVIYQQVDNNLKWSPLQKIVWFFLSELDDPLEHVFAFNYLKNDDNAVLRQKLRIQMTEQFVPFIEKWLLEGTQNKQFDIDNSTLMAEFIFTSFHSWVETSIYGDNLALRNKRITFSLPLYAQILKLPENTFSPANMRKLLK